MIKKILGVFFLLSLQVTMKSSFPFAFRQHNLSEYDRQGARAEQQETALFIQAILSSKENKENESIDPYQDSVQRAQFREQIFQQIQREEERQNRSATDSFVQQFQNLRVSSEDSNQNQSDISSVG